MMSEGTKINSLEDFRRRGDIIVDEKIFAQTLVNTLRKEILQRMFPVIPIEEKTWFGRGMDIYNSYMLRSQYNYSVTICNRLGGISSCVEYALFNEIAAIGPGVTFPIIGRFCKVVLRKELFGAKAIFVKLARQNPIKLDQNIFRFINELKFLFERILSASVDESNPDTMCSKVKILNVCSALLMRQQSYGDNKVREILTGILIMALNELSKLKKCDNMTLLNVQDMNFLQFYYMGRLYPSIILPASEEFYKFTIEILFCDDTDIHVTKVRILDMFVTFAENYPDKIREIGAKDFVQSLRKRGSITFEEHLLHGIFTTIKNAKKIKERRSEMCYEDFRNMLESASNLERLGRIIGGDKIMSLLKSISCEISNIILILTTCHTIAQLCIDIGNEYFAKWQDEFFITTLLRYIQRPDKSLCDRIAIDKIYALRALDVCSKNCLTPSLTKCLPELMEGIRKILEAYNCRYFSFTFENVIEVAIKTFCGLSHTVKDYITQKEMNQFRQQLCIYLHRYIVDSKKVEPNMHHMHYVIFNAFVQTLKYENSLQSMERVEKCFEKLMHNNFLPPDPLRGDFENGGDFRTYTCPSVVIVAKLSPEYLTQFAPIILEKIENIIHLARVSYVDIFKEYTLMEIHLRHLRRNSDCVTVEEFLMGKIYACKAILNLAKCNKAFFSQIGFRKVIDAMILNVSDKMYSMTQVTAAETLVVIMKIIKENDDEHLISEIYRPILQCLMDAVRSQNDPMTLLQVLRQLIAICKIIGPSGIDENLIIEIKDIYASRTNYATEYVNNISIESAGSHLKSKSRVIEELAKVCFENRLAASNTFIC